VQHKLSKQLNAAVTHFGNTIDGFDVGVVDEIHTELFSSDSEIDDLLKAENENKKAPRPETSPRGLPLQFGQCSESDDLLVAGGSNEKT